MSWAKGIVEGKHVGYAVNAMCEHPGCKKRINRGLAYKCGNDIGSGDGFCNGFFCREHLYYLGRGGVQVCQSCANDVARKQHRALPFPNAHALAEEREKRARLNGDHHMKGENECH